MEKKGHGYLRKYLRSMNMSLYYKNWPTETSESFPRYESLCHRTLKAFHDAAWKLVLSISMKATIFIRPAVWPGCDQLKFFGFEKYIKPRVQTDASAAHLHDLNQTRTHKMSTFIFPGDSLSVDPTVPVKLGPGIYCDPNSQEIRPVNAGILHVSTKGKSCLLYTSRCV